MKSAIDAIRAALQAGPTPGPWHAYIHPLQPAEFNGRADIVGAHRDDDVAENAPHKNARYIAACNPVAIRALLDALDQAQRDAERLDWLDENPDSIRRTQGYRGSANSWAVRNNDGVAFDFISAREAIDAAISATKEPQ